MQCCSALAQKDPLDFAASSMHSQTRGPRGAFVTAKLMHGSQTHSTLTMHKLR